jgi:predicted amidohydrolase
MSAPVASVLTIAAAQPRCVSYDVEGNALAHAAAIRSAGARVVVFPELSLTGYELDAPAVEPDDPRLAPVVEACAAAGSLALIGAPVPDGPHIGVLAIDRGGARVAYRKMWLGGDEPKHFTPGAGPSVIEVDGWRLGLAVCKDTGVPEHSAGTAAMGMDVYVAGILESAIDEAVLDERARRVAFEHGVWVVMASFAGSTGGGYGCAAGRSGIWSPDGVEVARTGPEPGTIAHAELVTAGARLDH